MHIVRCGGPFFAWQGGRGKLPVVLAVGLLIGGTVMARTESEIVGLPDPRLRGEVSLEQALAERRSVRVFATTPARLQEVSQLLWAIQGITDDSGGRTAPSAGALYPLEIILVAGKVEGLPPGVYRYRPEGHDLARAVEGDLRADLAAASVGQDWMKTAPLMVAVAAVFERTTGRYGGRGERYVHIDAGAAVENLCLQAVGLGMASTVVGAFEDRTVKSLLGLERTEKPLLLVPVGRPR